MFDSVTRDFIATAPGLPDLPAGQFAAALNEAYVEIATARLARIDNPQVVPQTLIATLNRLNRMADTLEAHVVLGISGDKARAAAFVAASARQAAAQIRRIMVGQHQTLLDVDQVSGDLTSSLLFLIAERSADAFEAARPINAAPLEGVRQQLAIAIANLARGNLSAIDVINPELVEPEPGLDDQAVGDLLYYQILQGVILAAQDCLGTIDFPSLNAAQAIFERVLELSTLTSTTEAIEGAAPPDHIYRSASLYAGPHHLAGLLKRAAGTLQTTATIRLTPPEGADGDMWRDWLLREASKIPFIWENHQRAIATGYLNVGSSLVMTTPTGSGKSTLSVLKIASTICNRRTVVYLAPTRALVSQVQADLEDRLAGLSIPVNIEDLLLEELGGEALPQIAVLTPESCLAYLAFAPELFANVGLLVFDECHLLSAPPQDIVVDGRVLQDPVDRRSIDANLCLLNFAKAAPEADYLLLSAMVSNGEELAQWVENSLARGRRCFPFDDKWKPTRQVKATVVYMQDEIDAAQEALDAHSSSVRKLPARPPKAVMDHVRALPYGLFSTSAGWNPDAEGALAVRPFLQVSAQLGANPGRATILLGRRQVSYPKWKISANRLEIAAEIAAAYAKCGLNVIVFCETTPWTASVAKNVSDLVGPVEVVLNENQAAWRHKALQEAGSEAAIYDAGSGVAAVHHGDLLPEERFLAESVFRESTGVKVLSATSTLAQGLNLPCDVVIMAGTDRLDDDDDRARRVPLFAHEILNALGRAGRARQAATGLGIVVPADPVVCDIVGANRIDNKSLLPTVFSDGDNCIAITDPITLLYDRIVVGARVEPQAKYLLRRLAPSFGAARDGIEGFAELTRRSFGYFVKARRDPALAEFWLVDRQNSLAQLVEPPPVAPEQDWTVALAAKTGASPELVAKIADALRDHAPAIASTTEWMLWLLDLLETDQADFDMFLRPDAVERVFARGYTSAAEGPQARARAREAVRAILPLWMETKTLIELEQAIVDFIRQHEVATTPTRAAAKATHARRFVLRLAPDLNYLAGLLAQIAKVTAQQRGEEPLAFTQMLPQLVKRGFETIYHFRISRDIDDISRQDVAQIYSNISAHLLVDAADNWETVTEKVERAQELNSIEVHNNFVLQPPEE
ncbi:MAG TPA: DEAD/DEAH box helicase [Acetobacteraceae bacterium]|nr:DEAD/DEAH box helicase [Acetobacteraceae bacterium]